MPCIEPEYFMNHIVILYRLQIQGYLLTITATPNITS
jgi:hypothetical protein